MIIIGIDPGMKGAIAVVNTSTNTVEVSVLHPLKLKRTGRKDLTMIDIAMAKELVAPRLNAPMTVAFIEEVHAMPKQGVTSMFSFGRGYGQLIGMLQALRIAVNFVTPKEWKKEILIKNNLTTDKDGAILYVENNHPNINLTPGRLKKPHDGIADAVCIMDYGRIIYDKV